jgi:hypothetical protein
MPRFVVKVPVSGTYMYVEEAPDETGAVANARSREKAPWSKRLIVDWKNVAVGGHAEPESDLLDEALFLPPGRQGRKVDWGKAQHLLGRVPDHRLAKELKVSAARVRGQRLKTKRGAVQEHVRVRWEMWDHLLGKVSDTELAYKIGCSRATVGARRKKLSKSPWRKGENDHDKRDEGLDRKPDGDY